ncbi:hypothetical protein PMEGAS67_00010 [Priestia megaterium]
MPLTYPTQLKNKKPMYSSAVRRLLVINTMNIYSNTITSVTVPSFLLFRFPGEADKWLLLIQVHHTLGA